MESASSIHHHQLQEHLLGSSSSCYGLTGSTTHDNTSSPFLNTNGFYPYPSETNLNQRLSSNYSFMAPDLGFQWATAGNQTTQDLQVSRNIKEELLDNYYLKYSTELVSNISNQEVLTNPVPSDMSLQPVDLLPSSRFSGSFSPISSQNQIGFSKGFSYSLNHMQQSYLMPFSTSNKISSNGRAAEAKRTCSTKMEPNAPKKSRLEGRASCPPFKVRKEKLGDRIAALQQLVAPFGKAMGVENIADRHSIRTNGGHWIYQTPSDTS